MFPTLKAVTGSFGSYPAMTSNNVAVSETFLVIGPMVSWVKDTGTIPSRLIKPRVGRSPTKLVADAGERIQPPASAPGPATAKLAATAAPVPPEDPPGVLVRS